MLEDIKKEIEKDFKLLKFEDERNINNGFNYIFTNGCVNIFGEDIDKIINWKEELEDNFDVHFEIEYNIQKERMEINLGGI
jgi:hypothetical protein